MVSAGGDGKEQERPSVDWSSVGLTAVCVYAICPGYVEQHAVVFFFRFFLDS